jgi:transglutaminase-like putative cysteine protease
MTTDYQIEYYTHNVYGSVVNEAFYEFLVAPCTETTQQIKDIRYWCSLPGQLFNHPNTFGFEATNIRAIKPFSEFEFRMNARVEKRETVFENFEVLPFQEEIIALANRAFIIDHYPYLYKQQHQSVFSYLQALNRHIYTILSFDPEPTNVHTTATEVIELGKGVCQDYTHLFLAFGRKNRIPCRYVSGYLNQGGGLTGSAVMHAWVEAFIPGYGWCGFDPTNNLLVNVNYIKAAHGTDYSDCSPIKGVLKTSGTHFTEYHVKVIPEMKESNQQ